MGKDSREFSRAPRKFQPSEFVCCESWPGPERKKGTRGCARPRFPGPFDSTASLRVSNLPSNRVRPFSFVLHLHAAGSRQFESDLAESEFVERTWNLNEISVHLTSFPEYKSDIVLLSELPRVLTSLSLYLCVFVWTCNFTGGINLFQYGSECVPGRE